jgi:hypothetical protein
MYLFMRYLPLSRGRSIVECTMYCIVWAFQDSLGWLNWPAEV